MKSALKWTGIVVGVLIVVFIGWAIYISTSSGGSEGLKQEQNRLKNESNLASTRLFRLGLELYFDVKGLYPATLEELASGTSQTGITATDFQYANEHGIFEYTQIDGGTNYRLCVSPRFDPTSQPTCSTATDAI